jgi:hypothetical protein
MHALRVLILLWFVTSVTAVNLGSSQSAFASESSCPPGTTPSQNPGGGYICVPVQDPGTPGGGASGGGSPGGGGGVPVCSYGGKTIPCVTGQGVWFSSQSCYAVMVSPPLPPTDASWKGRDPSKGDLWSCNMPDPIRLRLYFYVPGGAVPVLVDPGVLAERALGSMRLGVPVVGLAPSPPDLSYVGLETWLWMGRGQFRRLSLTVSAGGTSVRVVAVPVEAVWSMGDGGSVVCGSVGRVWVVGMGDGEVTDCSYTYERVSEFESGGVFEVSARLRYRVDWTCSGACLQPSGSLGVVDGLPGRAAIRVGERQSVVINP